MRSVVLGGREFLRLASAAWDCPGLTPTRRWNAPPRSDCCINRMIPTVESRRVVYDGPE